MHACAPLTWDEVQSDPEAFTITTVPDRLAEGDPWARLDEAAGSLDQLLALAEHDKRAGVPDAPWPPHFAKQEGEAPRVQPSKRAHPAPAAPGKSYGASGRRRTSMPLIEIARAASQADALAG
jgi:hypothetical protein